ncbi:sodium:proton antiporter [Paraliomyxa miuraensis]|uniref:sodium:proton antiporter n=1 Tax=Paraliomyxa miuraensis TaxID=376150 RepID=UPI002255895A|nr:sodium:proton antiporter [Paraliomyxa miuraensis]MCX4239975.1 sodium:proton antiporter [Paraliomyxa miuraensis]
MAALGVLLAPGLALASGDAHGAHHAPPPVWTTVFFVVMLLSIAILPLTPLEHWWHKNRNKLLLGLALAIYPVLHITVIEPDLVQLEHTVVEYAQFIILLGTLFFVSGGIYLTGDLKATPGTNLKFLVFGTLIASIVGTTGASMLLIRPVLRTNHERKYKVHVVIFFIFLVSNIGGSLLPIGDPPLFLGYLRGVPFTWTLGLWKEMATVAGLLLVVFFFLDRHFYNKESLKDRQEDAATVEPLRVEGKINVLWLAGIVVCVALTPQEWGLLREAMMVGCAVGSQLTSAKDVREKNAFTWFPILEVAALFIGIFLTMIPALMILKAQGGSLGVDSPAKFFWFTGVLSSFLDNAPTYLVFFSTAQGMVESGALAYPADQMVHMTVQGATEVPHIILQAISVGAVFMGANTYIGNGPNFMVKAIAEEQRVEMPGFFGYMKWSILLLIPCFGLVTVLFFLGH